MTHEALSKGIPETPIDTMAPKVSFRYSGAGQDRYVARRLVGMGWHPSFNIQGLPRKLQLLLSSPYCLPPHTRNRQKKRHKRVSTFALQASGTHSNFPTGHKNCKRLHCLESSPTQVYRGLMKSLRITGHGRFQRCVKPLRSIAMVGTVKG